MPKTFEELTADEQLAYLGEANESFEFLKKHVDYVSNPHNTALMTEAMNERMRETGTGWTSENLAFCYNEIRDRLTTDEPPTPEPIKKEDSTVPPYGKLTPQIVLTMPREDFKKWYTHPKWGNQFQQEVNDLKISRTRKT